mgnify:CR=1 FL=1
MSILTSIVVISSAFLAMEFVAWFTHKYIMHGVFWNIHADHHVKRPGFIEKNDLFILVFALPSWLFIMFGMMYQLPPVVDVGIGIALYGACYFLVHDVFIHQRFKWLKKSKNSYLMGIRKAHKVHHKHLGKEDGECFGMLIVPLKYIREAKRANTVSSR